LRLLWSAAPTLGRQRFYKWTVSGGFGLWANERLGRALAVRRIGLKMGKAAHQCVAKGERGFAPLWGVASSAQAGL